MNGKHSVVYDMKNKQLIEQRMSETRSPKQNLQWMPEGRRRYGRCRNSWQSDVSEEMREMGLENGMWNDRHVVVEYWKK